MWPRLRLPVMNCRNLLPSRNRLGAAALRFSLGLIWLGLSACGFKASDSDRANTLVQPTLRIRTFDPARAADVPSVLGVARIYETLLQYNDEARPYVLEPLLATTMPEVSPDGLTYTFQVRSGIYFQDDPCFEATGGCGRELTAQDFVYAIQRVADARTVSTGWWLFRNRIVGLDAFREATLKEPGREVNRPIEGLQAPDERTLVITLTQPYPQFLYVLAMHYAAAIPREAVDYYGDRLGQHPVGTGPFQLVSWDRNYRVVYRKNPGWELRGRAESIPAANQQGLGGRGLPGLDGIVDLVMADASTRWLAFLRGELDRCGLSQDQWDVVVDEHGALRPAFYEQGIRMASGPALQISYIAFNMDDPVVGTNTALRRAITQAFNTEEWLEFHNQRVMRPTGPIPMGLAGYREGALPFPYDLAAARQLMVEAGYPDGVDPATGERLRLTLELGRADDQELRQTAELIRHFVSQIGIRLELNFNHAPQFYDKLERRAAQLFYLSWIGDYPDAENFLQLFYGPSASPGPNRCNYVNPTFDRLFEQARVMPDSPERTARYEALAQIVIEDCPWVFASQPRDVFLYWDRVRNLRHHAFPYGRDKYVTMASPTLKAGP